MRKLAGIIALSALMAVQGLAPARALTPQPIKAHASPCVEEGNVVLRAAYHPNQAPLRCTRFLGTTTVAHGQGNPHT